MNLVDISIGEKIDRRIKYRIVLDTETTPLDRDLKAVDPYNMLVYDFGWAIVDKKGKVYRTRSFVNADVYIDERVLMKSAYYRDKLPKYEEALKNGTRVLASLYTIRRTLVADMQEYNITEIYAHNARFDVFASNNTQRYVTKSKYRYFFPYGTEIFDTMKMAGQVVCKTPTYIHFCEEHGYLTKAGKPKKTAEVLYRYISGDTEFSEEHQGLDDVMIEKEIMAYCFRKHKKMDGRLFKKRDESEVA